MQLLGSVLMTALRTKPRRRLQNSAESGYCSAPMLKARTSRTLKEVITMYAVFGALNECAKEVEQKNEKTEQIGDCRGE